MTVNAGDPAPDFDMPGDDGQISLSALKGKTVVLYFYPKDDTSGCTSEAKAFTEASGDFAQVRYVSVGGYPCRYEHHLRHARGGSVWKLCLRGARSPHAPRPREGGRGRGCSGASLSRHAAMLHQERARRPTVGRECMRAAKRAC